MSHWSSCLVKEKISLNGCFFLWMPESVLGIILPKEGCHLLASSYLTFHSFTPKTSSLTFASSLDNAINSHNFNLILHTENSHICTQSKFFPEDPEAYTWLPTLNCPKTELLPLPNTPPICLLFLLFFLILLNRKEALYSG